MVVFLFPANFGATIKSGKQANVVIVQDQSNPQISAITTAALQNVVEGYGKGVSAEKIGIMLAKTPGGLTKGYWDRSIFLRCYF